jgi:hypothetical protein
MEAHCLGRTKWEVRLERRRGGALEPVLVAIEEISGDVGRDRRRTVVVDYPGGPRPIQPVLIV